ncbi:ABC transporter permease [Pontibacter sp. JAM-7]|uniref:ABC transporter permease n=1 Tax=Pontibacter sp. JAM-7 TaxID=3366581 RepID=UPI003AF71236
MKALFSLALRQAITGLQLSEWRALMLALLLAIFSASLMAVLSDRLDHSLNRKGADLLGADLILQSSRPLSQELIAAADALQLRHSGVIQLATMASDNTQFLLISLRAAQANYPLRGEIQLEPSMTSSQPGLDEIWVEQAILERLNLTLGDSITLGESSFTISHILLNAPDRGRGFVSFNPQAIINQQALPATGLLLPGSRAQYRLLFAGAPDAVTQLKKQFQRELKTGERLVSVDAEEDRRGSALSRASSYLRLVAFLTLLLAGLTIFLSLRRFTRQQNRRAALLRTLGLSRQQLALTYLLQLGYLWLACSLVGIGLGWLAEQGLFYLLRDLLPQPVPAARTVLYCAGPTLGLFLVLGLALPALSQLTRTSPADLFHEQAQHASYPARISYLILAGFLLLCGLFYLNNLMLSIALLLVLLLTSLGIALLGGKLMQALGICLQSRLRLGALLQSRIQQQQRWYRLQIPVTCLLLSLLSINYLALTDLMQRWRTELPANTPDHFLINVQPWETESVQQILQTARIDSQLWPIYRGRLTGLNQATLAEQLNPKQLSHGSLNRELNLTWAAQLPEHNTLSAGQWQPDQPGVSVEHKLASELGLSVGDTVQFDIGGNNIQVPITSLRELRWDSFQPNFFYIFSPGVLSDLPASYITSFHLGERAGELSRALLNEHPTLTLIDVRQLLNQLQTLLQQLGQLTTLLLMLAALAALLLVYTTLHQELEQRQKENALLRTLGASAASCRRLDLLELSLTGLCSGVLALLITEFSLWPIHHYLLQLEPVLHPTLWLFMPLGSMLLFVAVGWFSHRPQSLSQSYRRLRQQF